MLLCISFKETQKEAKKLSLSLFEASLTARGSKLCVNCHRRSVVLFVVVVRQSAMALMSSFVHRPLLASSRPRKGLTTRIGKSASKNKVNKVISAVIEKPLQQQQQSSSSSSSSRNSTETTDTDLNVTPGRSLRQHSVVMKFGGSSVANAERMREVANIVLSFPEDMPILVLSAMGKSTNNLLLCGEESLKCENAEDVKMMKPLLTVKSLHEETMVELNVDNQTRKDVNALLQKLEQVCMGVCLMQEVTPRTRALLVSFGERMSTRIFASYLRSRGVNAKQYDAFDIGVVTSDEDFENGRVLQESYENLRKSLTLPEGSQAQISVVTGFLGKGENTGAITTLGRGGSDLTATVIGAALDMEEVQVWKDVDGVLSADPREVDNTIPMPFLSFDEAQELAYFGAQVLHPQAMRPAMDNGNLRVRVKNSYNIRAPGTIIGHITDADGKKQSERMDDWLLTSIVRKKNVTMLDIVSTRMLGQYGFLAKVFTVLQKNGISVDVVATSEVSVSLTLDPAKIWSRDLAQEELEKMKVELEDVGTARVSYSGGHSIISLIGNLERNNEIMERAFRALKEAKVTVKMVSQGASKCNISLLVDDEEGAKATKAIHVEFFGDCA